MRWFCWIILAVAVTTVQADVATELQEGVPVDQVLSNALDAGMNLNDAVGAAVAVDTQRAGDIVVAAMELLARLPEPDPARTYTVDNLLSGPIVEQVRNRYVDQDQYIVYPQDAQYITVDPYHALVAVVELHDTLCRDDSRTGPQPLRQFCEQDVEPGLFPKLSANQFEPLLITVFKSGRTEVSDGGDLIIAALRQQRDTLPTQFVFPENGVVTEESIAQAAILAGADPTVVTQAAAAGRVAAPGTPRPDAGFSGAGGLASPS